MEQQPFAPERLLEIADPGAPSRGGQRLSETWAVAPRRPTAATGTDACLVHIYPTGPGMGSRYTLGRRPLVLGRGADCDIRVEHTTVSRRHATVQPVEDGYLAVDLKSTNGTFVNDKPVTAHRLSDGDYLRVGNCIYRFLSGGNVEAEYHEQLYRLAIIDGLTEIHNKRYLLEFLERELARAARHGRPLSLVLFDIDHFKSVNDELGHLAGDFTLRELATRLKPSIRTEELFARYGGEEFAIVLLETPRAAAVHQAERMRQLVESEPFQFEERTFHVTISLGVADTGGMAITAQQLIARADEQLLRAKQEGRNRVCA